VTAQDRIASLAQGLRHYDVAQLAYQLAEIAGDRAYVRNGVEVHEGDLVLDVGANVGVAAAFFVSECGAGVVHCFEPVRPICELLRENVAAYPACIVHEVGLSRAPGTAEITFYPGAAAMSGLYADPDRDRRLVHTALTNLGATSQEADERLRGAHEPQVLACELTTLSAFLRGEGIDIVDLLKIDVERAELDVLAGIDEGAWAGIRQLVVEVHDQNGRLAAIAGELGARGFRVVAEQEPALRGTDVHLLYARRP
jgi:31-O-methyltransferase